MKKHSLPANWHLKQLAPTPRLDASVLAEAASPGDEWLPVPQMPMMVHDVLVHHGRIEAPWLPGRAEACRWVAESDWVYATSFETPGPAAPERHWFLRFGGLDTLCEAYLNGEQLFVAHNMYREVRVDVTGRLGETNTLVLHFRTVFEEREGKPTPIRHLDGDPARPVLRPQQNYSTYLGPHPYFSRVGVFDQVILEEVDPAGWLDELHVRTRLSEDLTRGEVSVGVRGVCGAGGAAASILVTDPEGIVVAAERLALKRGPFHETAALTVERPQLWWPRGYGDQPLYHVRTALLVGQEEVHVDERRVGFRRVTMPRPLHFEVNGVSVRMWGGNWAALDWATAVWDQDRAERLFDLAENAHFNAFRVWGVNEAPGDGFYELADERGFMVWQDFHGMQYNPTEANRLRCREEAALQITRWAHHPSVFLWCGGNEAAMWHESEFGGPGGEWPGTVVVEEDVKAVCGELDPDRYFHPNSPYHGLDANDPREWDTHGYTNMWWVPGYDYLVYASEDTRISAPPLHSLKRFMAEDALWPDDYSPLWTPGCRHPWPETWMNYTTGQSEKKTGPVERLHEATDPAGLVYRLGRASALYYQDLVERQRRGRPAEDESGDRCCGGYLVWKYNDSWPQIYSAKVDYFLEPYLVYYALKQAYAPVLLSFEVGSFLWLWLVNDTREMVAGTVNLEVWHMERNEIVHQVGLSASAQPGESVVLARLDQLGIGTLRRECVLFASLTDAHGEVVARASSLLHHERWLNFPPARLDLRQEGEALTLTTDQFARSIELTGNANGDEFGWFFEDNWFDLLPGETKTVRVLGRHNTGTVTARPWFSPHASQVSFQRSE